MKKNKLMIISIALSIVNLIASLIYIGTLPEIVPTHYNQHFEVDGIGSKYIGLITAFLPLLISGGILLELKLREKDYPNRKVLQIVMFIISLYFICVNWFLMFSMLDAPVMGAKSERMEHIVWLPIMGIGLLFVAMGNFLPTVTQNKTLGIKLSWTLENEQCWKLTHRFGGKVFVLGGLLLLLLCFIGMITGAPAWILLVVFMVILTAIMVIVSVYAYQHRND